MYLVDDAVGTWRLGETEELQERLITLRRNSSIFLNIVSSIVSTLGQEAPGFAPISSLNCSDTGPASIE